MGRSKGERLTPSERDRIVELRLNGLSKMATAAAVGCDHKTVDLWWHQWLDDTAADRAEHLERHRAEIVARMDRIAGKAAGRQDDVDTVADFARLLAEERQALREMARVLGLDQVTVQAALVDPPLTVDEAKARLERAGLSLVHNGDA